MRTSIGRLPGAALHAAAIAAAGLLAVPHVAAASPNTVVGVCAHVTQWSFSTPLTTFSQSGTMSVSYSGDCEYAWELFSGASAYDVVQEALPQQWTWQHGFAGTCVLATTVWQVDQGGTGSGLLVGGTVSVARYAAQGGTAAASLEVDVLPTQSPGPCDEATATGATGTAGFITW